VALSFKDFAWRLSIFKPKTWIQTTEDAWDKTFTYDLFSVEDEDWNQNMPDDDNTDFDDEDFKDDITLTIVEPNYPDVEITNLSNNYIWPNTSDDPDSQVTFSWSQTWQYKVVINWNWDCSTWNVLVDWTDYTDTWSSVTVDINASDLPDEWQNTIFTCIKNDNDDVWSANISITKDSSEPSVDSIWASPANVVDQDSSVSFKCRWIASSVFLFWTSFI